MKILLSLFTLITAVSIVLFINGCSNINKSDINSNLSSSTLSDESGNYEGLTAVYKSVTADKIYGIANYTPASSRTSSRKTSSVTSSSKAASSSDYSSDLLDP